MERQDDSPNSTGPPRRITFGEAMDRHLADTAIADDLRRVQNYLDDETMPIFDMNRFRLPDGEYRLDDDVTMGPFTTDYALTEPGPDNIHGGPNYLDETRAIPLDRPIISTSRLDREHVAMLLETAQMLTQIEPENTHRGQGNTWHIEGSPLITSPEEAIEMTRLIAPTDNEINPRDYTVPDPNHPGLRQQQTVNLGNIDTASPLMRYRRNMGTREHPPRIVTTPQDDTSRIRYVEGVAALEYAGLPAETLQQQIELPPRQMPILVPKKNYTVVPTEADTEAVQRNNDLPNVDNNATTQIDMRRTNVPTVPQVPPVPVARPRLNIVPRPDINPYINLSRAILDGVARERDIQLFGIQEERAQQLHELDAIMPDWINAIRAKTIDNFQILAGSQLYVFGALYGISFNDLGHISNRDLVNYIRISILIKNPLHHGRECLPVLIRQVNRTLLEILARQLGIDRDELRFISTDDLRTAVVTQKRDHILVEDIRIMADRYRTITQHKYSRLIRNLYNINRDDEEDWINAARSAPHPLESVILNLDSYDLNDVINQFQIVIPLAYSTTIANYIKNNIVAYAEVLTRGNLDPVSLNMLYRMPQRDVITYLSKLTDKEIFNLVGVYVAYDNRVSLVTNIAATISTATPCFFYPTIRTYERSTNRETISLSDIMDANVFMVAYGNAISYSMYEIEDFLQAFHRGADGDLISFSNPLNPAKKFTTAEVEALRQLLISFEQTPEITRLVAQIDDGLIDVREKTQYDDAARETLLTLEKDKQNLVKQFLRQLFYVGMYMRRWEGPGHPFPLRDNDTRRRIDQDELDGIIKTQIEPAAALLDEMGQEPAQYCLNLRICQYKIGGGIEVSRQRLGEEWHDVGKGKQCIRIASSKFVGTGYHYLRVLFRETIPGLDVAVFDRIM